MAVADYINPHFIEKPRLIAEKYLASDTVVSNGRVYFVSGPQRLKGQCEDPNNTVELSSCGSPSAAGGTGLRQRSGKEKAAVIPGNSSSPVPPDPARLTSGRSVQTQRHFQDPGVVKY